ncbi:PREDICTED: NAC domain-containing protein 7-like [Ipomoea nil]|uniref:NAC domain-containing protein 7-like n=1 Tax=Ipomoea nil TaxID=35883 RepID=UPI0009016ADE|nr:PREDICTED: NAC domain-containing protein 7-like [Ipomoea nil]
MEFGVGMGSRQHLPVGFVFSPTDSELIDYLKKKINGRPLPSDIIKEIPYLYEYPPELLPIGEFEDGRENEAYYFTHKGKKSPPGELLGGKKFDGQWKSNGPEERVFADNQILGFKKELYLYRREKMSGWVIREYRCNPELVRARDILDLIQNYVVLHIMFDPDLRGTFSAEDSFSIPMEVAKGLSFFNNNAEN